MPIKLTVALLKKPANLLKRHTSTAIFLGVTKGVECLQQNIFDRLRLLDFNSEQVK